MRATRSHFLVAAFAAALVTAAALGAAQAQSVTDPQKTPTQPSPQGRTGPLNTGAGGTAAENPQGETPPNMQATSPGAAEAPKGK